MHVLRSKKNRVSLFLPAGKGLQGHFEEKQCCHSPVLTPERSPQAAKPQLAPDHCGAEPIFKCLHLVPPTFIVALGVVTIRTHRKLLGHLTLYFLGSACLNSAPVLLTVQNFTFENRSKRRPAEQGRDFAAA